MGSSSKKKVTSNYLLLFLRQFETIVPAQGLFLSPFPVPDIEGDNLRRRRLAVDEVYIKNHTWLPSPFRVCPVFFEILKSDRDWTAQTTRVRFPTGPRLVWLGFSNLPVHCVWFVPSRGLPENYNVQVSRNFDASRDSKCDVKFKVACLQLAIAPFRRSPSLMVIFMITTPHVPPCPRRRVSACPLLSRTKLWTRSSRQLHLTVLIEDEPDLRRSVQKKSGGETRFVLCMHIIN